MPVPSNPGIRLADLAALTGAALVGDAELRIRAVSTLERAGEGDIAFVAHPKYRPMLAATRAAAVIVLPDDRDATDLPRLVAANPYAAYAKVASALNPEPRPAPGVHPSAVVGAGASIAADACIGPHVVIGERAVVGARAVVGPGSVVGDDAVLGEDVRLVARVTIYPRCRIGARTLVHAGAVIGADGFGMAEDRGEWIKIPQLGRVVIGADCEIGANTTIDRGALDDTVIEDDVKLDNQIQVGHNCVIGRHTAIAGCAGVAGSVRIGRNCKIGGGVGIVGHLEIADNVTIGGGTVVAHAIREPGMYSGSFPMLPHREWQHAASQTRRLRELADRVRRLERAHETKPGEPQS
jgi:UDP-3-O-[3-hydroxymyristoyl] glucosamine N-acyltransferase